MAGLVASRTEPPLTSSVERNTFQSTTGLVASRTANLINYPSDPSLFQSTAGLVASRTPLVPSAGCLVVRFQSTADPLASRTAIRADSTLRQTLFQSTADPLASRTRGANGSSIAPQPVSIHGRPVGQPHRLLRPRLRLRETSFNPRPTRWPAAPSAARRQARGSGGFNPRPARWPTAPPYHLTSLAAQKCFNPRPARRPAAPHASIQQPGFIRQFQSTADPLASRTARSGGCNRRGPGVSIHGRPVGQPHREGVAAQDRERGVSIHGRPVGQPHRRGGFRQAAANPRFNPRPTRWPAAPRSAATARARRRSFNPRPSRWPAAPWYTPAPSEHLETFQSTADPLASRTATSVPSARPVTGFNPRPTRWPAAPRTGRPQ